MSTTRKPRSTAAPRSAAASGAAKKTAAPRSRAKKTSTAAAAAPAVVIERSKVTIDRPASPAVSNAGLQGTAAPAAAGVAPEAMHRMIAEAAYYRAERRGFVPGREESDWFEAEAEVRASARLR